MKYSTFYIYPPAFDFLGLETNVLEHERFGVLPSGFPALVGQPTGHLQPEVGHLAALPESRGHCERPRRTGPLDGRAKSALEFARLAEGAALSVPRLENAIFHGNRSREMNIRYSPTNCGPLLIVLCLWLYVYRNFHRK